MKPLKIWVIVVLAVACQQTLAYGGNQEIAERIGARFRENGQLKSYSISVRFQGGTATLRGTASSQQQIELATEVAREVPGVQEVVNELMVAAEMARPALMVSQDPARSEEKNPPQEPSDMDDKGAIKVAWLAPAGATVVWNTAKPDGAASKPAICPTLCTLHEGEAYSLRIEKLPGRPDAKLIGTLELSPITPGTREFLIGNAIPVLIQDDDIARGSAGKSVTKVIYLPDEHSGGITAIGVETLTSSPVAPERDPIMEADRRGVILAILRIKPTADGTTSTSRRR